jgi:hypothetical protein
MATKKLTKQIADLYAAEQKLANKTKEVVNTIVETLSDVHLDGVECDSSSKIKIATVPFSTIKNNSFNLSAEYYISECQMEAIKNKLSDCTSITQVLSFVNEAVNGRVVIKGEKIRFNSAVIAKLKEIQKMF